eukprot:14318096-Ditylum_brightwellii.AAC.1
MEAKEDTSLFVSTVAKNKELFTERQYCQAELARKIYSMMGRPSEDDFINMVKMQLMPNCPITAEDIRNARAIFGKDIGVLKGKTVRRTPLPVVTDYIHVPPQLYRLQHLVTLCADIMFINKMPFSTSISCHLHFVTANRLANRTIKTSLKEFDPLKGALAPLGIDMNPTATAEHVPEIKRTNR